MLLNLTPNTEETFGNEVTPSSIKIYIKIDKNSILQSEGLFVGFISYIYFFLYIAEISLTSAKYLQKTPPPSVCLLSLRQRSAAFSSSRVFCWQKGIPALGRGTQVMLRAQGALGYVIPRGCDLPEHSWGGQGTK